MTDIELSLAGEERGCRAADAEVPGLQLYDRGIHQATLGVGRDLAAQTAGSPHGPWRLSNSPALTLAFPNASLAALGLPSLVPSKPINLNP